MKTFISTYNLYIPSKLAKPLSTLLAKQFILSVEQWQKSVEDIRDIAHILYSSVVGCLMYICIGVY